MTERITTSNSYRTLTIEDIAGLFNAELLDAQACAIKILEKLYPSGPRCPECGRHTTDKITLNNFYYLKRCKCKSCNRWFSALSNTILQNSQLSPRDIIILAVFSHYSIAPKEIAMVLKIHPDTVKLWQRKLKVNQEIKD